MFCYKYRNEFFIHENGLLQYVWIKYTKKMKRRSYLMICMKDDFSKQTIINLIYLKYLKMKVIKLTGLYNKFYHQVQFQNTNFQNKIKWRL